MEEDHQELQLLPSPHPQPPPPPPPSSSFAKLWAADPPPSLDLQLSISLRPIGPPSAEALRWQAAEQIRMAAVEKAYAERVRELSRREMELAQSEFARARQVWERARAEVEKAERMKERAVRRVDASCIEITCQSCRQSFSLSDCN